MRGEVQCQLLLDALLGLRSLSEGPRGVRAILGGGCSIYSYLDMPNKPKHGLTFHLLAPNVRLKYTGSGHYKIEGTSWEKHIVRLSKLLRQTLE